MLEDLLMDELFSGESQFALDHRGHAVAVVVENSGPISTTVRLFVGGRLVDTKHALSTTVRLPTDLPGPEGPHRIEVKVSLSLLGDVKACTLREGPAQLEMPRLDRRS
ncbi:hypothetical protein [Ornithinimicrobium faecis]|uniref:Uncharacterized protein n=1 Tax=Ornithinimicrobium faecis TaxID=2934158 RepID=A0ABY4YSI9_9MICO|nr:MULTISPECIES: hypothetical protein [unclassified Ornithinimicrobium]USQ79736.1 hypothetical protein NF556_19455 [Ornithinimicrobium sp. HY1793]